jgi:ABC-2 type transport system ATP-binding protein
MIEISNVDFSYGKNKVFDSFNCKITDKIFGLIGVNGAGKSTLLKLAVGLLNVKRGDITLNNQSITSNKFEVLKIIGVLHENPKFPPWAEVLAYLRMVGELRGLSRKQAYTQSLYLLEIFNLLDRINDPVSNLSAGLTQRFGLAQAIIGVPKIIFLDEPTANLDAGSRIQVLDYLKYIARNYDSQIIIMSHVLSDLERFCDAIAILHDGEVKYKSSIAKLLSTHSHRNFSIRGSQEEIHEAYIVLQKMDVKIIDHKPLEIMLEITNNDKNQIKHIQSLLPSGTIIMPTRSILEQKFLDVTGTLPNLHTNDQKV